MASRISGGIGGVLIMLGLALAGMFCATPVQAQQYKGSYETTAEVPLREGPGNYHKIIITLPKGIQINVVGKDNKVDLRLVSLGATDGALVMVRSGVSGDEKVISGNLQKIGPGAVVQPLEQ